MDYHYEPTYDHLFGFDPRDVYMMFAKNFPCNCSIIQARKAKELQDDEFHYIRQNDSSFEISELLFEMDENINWHMPQSMRLILLLIIVVIIVSAIMVLSYVAYTVRVTQVAKISSTGEKIERATSTHGWLKSLSFETRTPNQSGIKASGSIGMITYYIERNSRSFTTESSIRNYQAAQKDIL